MCVSELTTPHSTVYDSNIYCMHVIIIDSATLRVLNVSWNDIGDDGMALISKELQKSKSFTGLIVYECRLSVEGNVVCGFNEYIL